MCFFRVFAVVPPLYAVCSIKIQNLSIQKKQSIIEQDFAVMTPIMTGEDMFQQIWQEYAETFPEFQAEITPKIERPSSVSPLQWKITERISSAPVACRGSRSTPLRRQNWGAADRADSRMWQMGKRQNPDQRQIQSLLYGRTVRRELFQRDPNRIFRPGKFVPSLTPSEGKPDFYPSGMPKNSPFAPSSLTRRLCTIILVCNRKSA